MNFIDFQKAFDSVDRYSLWKIMTHYGLPPKFINIIKDLYECAQCSVQVDNELSSWFDITTGVRQGCILSPVLFGMAIDFVMRNADGKETGIPWTDNNVLGDLDFADDLCLLNTNTTEAQAKQMA